MIQTDIFSLIDRTKFKHSQQVAKISALLAKRAGYPQNEQQIIEQAALLHDIGKSDIPKSILDKPGKLTKEEFEIVKQHADIGYKHIMDAILILNIAALIAKYHHERPDGKGYHNMSNIHPYAKLIAVADVFDALYSLRPYKPPWEIPDIHTYFTEQSGTQFDSEYVTLLLDNIEEILNLYKNQ